MSFPRSYRRIQTDLFQLMIFVPWVESISNKTDVGNTNLLGSIGYLMAINSDPLQGEIPLIDR